MNLKTDTRYLNDDCYKIISDLNNMRLHSNWDQANNLRMIANVLLVKKWLDENERRNVNVIDLGSGRCILYEYFKRMNLDLNRINYYGIEMNNDFYLDAKDKYQGYKNFCIRKIDFNTAAEDGYPFKFDFVFMLEVVEHMPKEDFVKFIPNAKNLMHSTSQLVISTPNPDKENGEHLVWKDDHLYEYSKKELVDLFKNDFNLVDCFGWWTRSTEIEESLKRETNEHYLYIYRQLRKQFSYSVIDPLFASFLEKNARQMTYIFKTR